MADVFVSYAREDEAQATKVAEALRAQGYRAWRDDELPGHRRTIEFRGGGRRALVGACRQVAMGPGRSRYGPQSRHADPGQPRWNDSATPVQSNPLRGPEGKRGPVEVRRLAQAIGKRGNFGWERRRCCQRKAAP